MTPRELTAAFLVCLSIGWRLLLAPAASAFQTDPPELLRNPGLDGPTFMSQCCGEDGWPINEVQVAEGWTAWWRQIPPDYVRLPENCLEKRRVDYGCYWARPEFSASARTGAAYRIYGGDNSQKYFTFGRMHEAGLYQRVTGVVPGARLRFSVYLSAWMCASFAECRQGLLSDQPTTMHLRVGIDPTGGTDPFGPNVVWSAEADSFDRWTQYHVEAIARGEAVTVFTHSRPEWTLPRMANDIYVDEASLKMVEAPQPTTTPGAGSRLPSPTTSARPRAQKAQRPDGALTHVVQDGDTLFGVALAYGTSVDEIARLNRLRPGDPLQAGQELVVRSPTQPADASATPRPTASPTQKDSSPPAILRPVSGKVCVEVYNDWNTNGLRDDAEELAGNVSVAVFGETGLVASYTTNGVDEPYCFDGLAPGVYAVRAQPPEGYGMTASSVVTVTESSQAISVALGVRPDAAQQSAQSIGPGVIMMMAAALLVVGLTGGVVMRRRCSSAGGDLSSP